MIQKCSFVDHLIPKPPPVEREYDENVLDLADAEEIIPRYKLSSLQKLWLLNLKNRDGILTLYEEPGELILTLENDNEKYLVMNGRVVHEMEELLKSKDPRDAERKETILNQYIHGMHVPETMKVADKAYDSRSQQYDATWYMPDGYSMDIRSWGVSQEDANTDDVIPGEGRDENWREKPVYVAAVDKNESNVLDKSLKSDGYFKLSLDLEWVGKQIEYCERLRVEDPEEFERVTQNCVIC